MPWSGAVLPSLIGQAFPVKRSSTWSTEKQDALSGKRTRYTYFTYPIYAYEISFNVLRSAAALLELQTLLGFINSVNGPTQLWGYSDPNDNSASAQQFGAGDGSTTGPFQLVRSYGGFAEPVFLLNGNPSIYVNGVLKTLTTDYTIDAYGNVTFTVAPGNGLTLTWTGAFYWPCRFDDDVIDFINAMSGLFSLKSLKFSTEKLA